MNKVDRRIDQQKVDSIPLRISLSHTHTLSHSLSLSFKLNIWPCTDLILRNNTAALELFAGPCSNRAFSKLVQKLWITWSVLWTYKFEVRMNSLRRTQKPLASGAYSCLHSFSWACSESFGGWFQWVWYGLLFSQNSVQQFGPCAANTADTSLFKLPVEANICNTEWAKRPMQEPAKGRLLSRLTQEHSWHDKLRTFTEHRRITWFRNYFFFPTCYSQTRVLQRAFSWRTPQQVLIDRSCLPLHWAYHICTGGYCAEDT